MVNLSLFRHFEVLKRANSAVRFSIVLIAAWAGTLTLLLKLSNLLSSGGVSIDWNVFASFSAAILFSIIIAIVSGALGGDAEAKNADVLINQYLITSSPTQQATQDFIKYLNAASAKMESCILISNVFNIIACIIIASVYVYFAASFVPVSADFITLKKFYIPILLLLVILLISYLWVLRKK